MTRFEKEQTLINKFRSKQDKVMKDYAKKVKGLVDSALDQEYDIIIMGKEYKPKKVKESKSFDFSK